MDSSIIEQIGIACLKNLLLGSEIDPGYIKEGDKEVSWDGNLYVYDSKEKRKLENLRYRIPVQIKSTKAKTKSELANGKIIYRISRERLRHYMVDNGVLLIRPVFFDKNTYKIYVKDLLPVEIKKLFSDNRKKIPLKLRRKDDLVSFLKFCDYFFDNRVLQPTINLGVDTPKNAYEGMEMLVDFREIIPNSTKEIDYNAAKFYWKKEDGSVIPMKSGSFGISKTINKPIIINGKKFYDSYSYLTDKEGNSFRVGENLFVYRENKDININLNWIRGKKYTNEKINDYLFLSTFLMDGRITTDDGFIDCTIFDIKVRLNILYNVYLDLSNILKKNIKDSALQLLVSKIWDYINNYNIRIEQ